MPRFRVAFRFSGRRAAPAAALRGTPLSAALLHEQRGRLRLDPFAATEIAELLVGLRLHVHAFERQPEIGRDVRAHRLDVRRELRRLCDDRAVDVLDREAGGLHARDAFAQQHAAVGALERGVGVGEMTADVAERRRAEQCVGDRVQQYVRVRVAEQAALVRNRHAADDERAPRNELVHVVALSDSEIHACSD